MTGPANTLQHGHFRRFFGSNASANQGPKKQTTLAFGGKRQRVTDEAATDASAEQGAEPTPSAGPNGVESSNNNLKREKAEDAEDSDGSDVQPVSKRRRKITKDRSSSDENRSPSPKRSPRKSPKELHTRRS